MSKINCTVMKEYIFDAKIQKHAHLDAAFIEFPYNVEREFGMCGRVKVKATFDGVTYRGSLVTMGHRCHILGLTKEIRSVIGKQPGDMVHVAIQQDTEPRTVPIPADLQQIFAQNPLAATHFNALSYTHQKEYVCWIEDAKKAETRQRRLEKTVARLSASVKRPG